jgi:hypothetical protein
MGFWFVPAVEMRERHSSFAGDEIAVRLLLYMLTCLGEAEKEDEWAAVTSDI